MADRSHYTNNTDDQDTFAADTYDGTYTDDTTYGNSQYDNGQYDQGGYGDYDNSQYDQTYDQGYDQSYDQTYDQGYDNNQGGYDTNEYDDGTYGDSQYSDGQQKPYSDDPYSDQPESYADQPYAPSQDTGAAMMAYDENQEYSDQPPDGDDEYDYGAGMVEYDENQDEEYYDDDEEPRHMPADYYAEYPEDEYDEEEDERARRARRRRAWCCCLLLLCCLLILIILLIIFLLSMQDKDDGGLTDPPTFAPFVDDTDDDYYFDDDIIIAPGVKTTVMAPYDYDCDYDDQEGFPNVFDQCRCDGEITVVPQDVVEMRALIIERMFGKFYENRTANSLPLESCDPSNMALIWLASGDMRDSGEVRQRFALGMVFFQLNGTIWDYTDEWLSDLNECLWLGVQCNNRDAVNSLALDTNNIFGPVRRTGCTRMLQFLSPLIISLSLF